MITNIINEQIVKEETEKRSIVTGEGITGWRSSGLGTCMRGRFLNRLLSGTGIKPEIDPRTLRVFEMGNQVEEWLVKRVMKGVENKYSIETQIEFFDPDYNLSGHCDLFLWNKMTTGDSFPEEYICECKSKHSKAFWYMDKKGEGAQKHHMMQLHSYLYMFNKYGGVIKNPDGSVRAKIDPRGGKLKEGSIVYVSKDDMAMLEYPVMADNKELEKMWKYEMDTLNTAWNTKTAPPAPETGSWQEKYCDFCKLGLCSTLDDAKVKILFEEKAKLDEEEAKKKKEKEEEPKQPKFKVGDYVIGNEQANELYSHTRQGYRGKVTEVFADENLMMIDGCYHVHEDAFDLEKP